MEVDSCVRCLTWNRMELLNTSFGKPSMFGVSGMVLRNLSTFVLNLFTFLGVGLCRYFGCRSFKGKRLNSCGALLKKDAPLIVCTQSGA